MDNPLSDADIRVTQGIFEALKKQKNNEEFHDIVVVAGSTEFKCQRAILAAVSGFFRGLLTSGMKECLESRVELRSISEDVFSQILDCIYSGRSILTSENCFDIWTAADILDASFLLEDCRFFFKQTLSVENCIEYCVRLRLLSEESQRKALTFVATNFKELRYSERLFKLNFEEMKYLVSSEELAVCFEDDIIETILLWAESTPTLDTLSDILPMDVSAHQDSEELAEDVSSSRSDLLAELLECSRYLLISYSFLVQTLSCHPLVKGHDGCMAVVDKINRYLANPGLHQEWCPPEAIHREGDSVKRNVFLIYNRRGKAKVIYPPSATCYEIKRTTMNLNRSFEVDSRIFYLGGSFLTFDFRNVLLLHTPVVDGWNTKIIAEGWKHHHTVLVGQSLYWFKNIVQANAIQTIIVKLRISDIMNPQIHAYQWPLVGHLSVVGFGLKATTSIGTKVIVFWEGESSEGFTVECFDLFQRKSTVMRDRMGSTADLVTFRRDNEVFALQTNGTLWRISLCSSSDQLEFTKEYQFWRGSVPLHGAFLYGTHLFIFGDSVSDMYWSTSISVRGVFENVIFHNSKFCRHAHAVLNKNEL
ncbi:kelch-like 30 [Plakobranchus ocellatus]|uniref:Kelch-like 30 n=1 Tax=Plakobranchus ocellatus TaxID=259542 RepID=A0AAV4CHX2_9GAST|nr:kelch-like 30 [Plakobranchus ocellatus]